MTSSARLVEFARQLRREGLNIPSTAASDFASTLAHVGVARGSDVYFGLRSVAVTRKDDIPVFDRVFVRFFAGEAAGTLAMVGEQPRSWAISAEEGDEGGEGDGEDVASHVGASDVDRLSVKDFAELTQEEQAEVRSLIAAMVWEPDAVRSRRRKAHHHRDRPDLRRTLRRSIGPTGDLMPLAFDTRKARIRPVVLIADVSGSMEQYSEMLLYFAHAARARLGPIEAFVFATRLDRITRELAQRDPIAAIRKVSAAVEDWSGGTRIGESIAAFNRIWSRRVTRRGPICIVISDGWERGDPDLLATEMARLHRSVSRLIWLNPLASREGYAPETRGMKAALPHIDDFLPAGNLRDLATIVAMLDSLA